MLLENHPIHKNKDAEEAPRIVSVNETLAMTLAAIECYESRLIDLCRERDILKELA